MTFGSVEEKIFYRQVTKHSLACRVVDKQQIGRHYATHDFAKFAVLQEPDESRPPLLNRPRDDLLAGIVARNKNLIVKIEDYDFLLKNIVIITFFSLSV